MITEAFKERVKAATNLKDLVSEYVEVSPAGYNIWQSRCPHPDHNDSTPSFRIFYNKNKTWSWCCMGCHSGKKSEKYKNFGSDCIAFIQWISNYAGSKHKVGWREAIEILAKRADIPMEEEKYEEQYHALKLQAKALHANLLPEARQYLFERGLDDSDLKKWMIGFGVFRERGRTMDVSRITFPLLSKYNRIVGFTKRKLPKESDDVPKYWNSPTSEWFYKRMYLYGMHLYDSDFEEIRITEGPMDVILGVKYGVKNLMAPLGTSFTEEHADYIKNTGKIPCFCLDGDAAGLKALKRAVEMMADRGVYSKILILPNKKDLADMANELKDGLEDFIESNSMLYWQYAMKDTTAEFESKVNELRLKVLPLIQKAQKSAMTTEEKILLKSYVKERFGISL